MFNIFYVQLFLARCPTFYGMMSNFFWVDVQLFLRWCPTFFGMMSNFFWDDVQLFLGWCPTFFGSMSNFFWDDVQLFLGNVQLFLGNVQLFSAFTVFNLTILANAGNSKVFSQTILYCIFTIVHLFFYVKYCW